MNLLEAFRGRVGDPSNGRGFPSESKRSISRIPPSSLVTRANLPASERSWIGRFESLSMSLWNLVSGFPMTAVRLRIWRIWEALSLRLSATSARALSSMRRRPRKKGIPINTAIENSAQKTERRRRRSVPPEKSWWCVGLGFSRSRATMLFLSLLSPSRSGPDPRIIHHERFSHPGMRSRPRTDSVFAFPGIPANPRSDLGPSFSPKIAGATANPWRFGWPGPVCPLFQDGVE